MAERPLAHGPEETRDGHTSYVTGYIDFYKFTNNKNARWSLGREAWDLNGKKWRYVQFDVAVTLTSDETCKFVCLKDATDDWLVTDDVSANLAGDHPVGLVFGAPTAKQYGWVQYGGPTDTLSIPKEGAAITVGAHLINGDTTSGSIELTTDAYHYATARAAAAATDTHYEGRLYLENMDY